jgi:hypothetical protein
MKKSQRASEKKKQEIQILSQGLTDEQLRAIKWLAPTAELVKDTTITCAWSKPTIEAVLRGARKNGTILQAALEIARTNLNTVTEKINEVNQLVGSKVNTETPVTRRKNESISDRERMLEAIIAFRDALNTIPQHVQEPLWKELMKHEIL